jgi:pyridoxal 5'-phosphate synthase pdxT subunit
MRVGVLALQGDFREHLLALEECGVLASTVRRPSELAAVDALVLPGGESTAIANLARSFDIFEPLKARIASGMPVYGSCAGMILLADRVLDPAVGQETFGGLDITVRRNAFGRQVDSFETDLEFAGITNLPVRAVFIRAPWVESVGATVEVLATYEHAVAVRQGGLLATSFHPELTGDNRIHRFFIESVARPALERAAVK